MNEQEIERAIQDKNLTAPRITPQDIDALIIGEQYYLFPGTMVTVCCLTLKNGFNVTGDAACVSEGNFDEAIGRSVARAEARNKIWVLEGYRLKQELYKQ